MIITPGGIQWEITSMLRAIRPKNKIIYGMMFIPLLIYIFSIFVPLITAGWFGFFNWQGGPKKSFIGIENYKTLLQDHYFWSAFGRNIYLIVACVIGQIGFAFIFIILLNSKVAKVKGIHRTFAFFPSTISAVALGFVWSMMYNFNFGVFNWGLDKLKLTTWVETTFFNGEPLVWLGNSKYIMFFVSLPLIWQYIGYYMVIMLSAISSIDPEIFEVAELDGANAFQRAVHIVFPLIKNTIVVCITLCIAGNMRAFDHIYNLTAGGPGTDSQVMALYGYFTSFRDHNMGYGSAISIGIFATSLALIFITRVAMNRIFKSGGE